MILSVLPTPNNKGIPSVLGLTTAGFHFVFVGDFQVQFKGEIKDYHVFLLSDPIQIISEM